MIMTTMFLIVIAVVVCLQVIKDYQLMALVCALVLFDVLVLTVWEFVNPLAIVTYNTSTEHTVLIILMIIFWLTVIMM